MKKTTVFLLLTAFLLSLCSCGKTEAVPAEEPSPAEGAAAAESASALPDGTGEAKEPGILYACTVSPLSGGYCVLTMKDALCMSADEGFTGDLVWRSSDEAVAVVEDGLILPAGPGMAEITVSDGETMGAAVVLVNTAPGEVSDAGQLLIETGGELYECGLPVPLWEAAELEPRYCIADFPVVYEAEGVAYVRAEYLLNILCCVCGETTVLTGPEGSLPQLTGSAELWNAQPEPETRFFGQDGKTALLTVSLRCGFPDGSLRGERLLTQTVENGAPADVIPYHAYIEDGDVWLEAGYWLSVLGADCPLRYDTERQALIVTVEKG